MNNKRYNEIKPVMMIKDGEITNIIAARRIVSNDGLSCVDIIRSNNADGSVFVVYCYNRHVNGYGHLQCSGRTLDEAIKRWREKYAEIQKDFNHAA